MQDFHWLLKPPHRLYRFAVPASWGLTCLINFRYPGDEYGGFAASSLPGLWAAAFIDSGSPLQMLPVILIAGLVVTMAWGLLMDWLSVPWGPWYAMWVIGAGFLFWWSVVEYPTWDRAISRNGSIEAYVLPSLNVGLMASSVTMTMATAAWRSVVRLFRTVRLFRSVRRDSLP